VTKLPPLVKKALRAGSGLSVGRSHDANEPPRYIAGICGLWASGRSAEAALDELEKKLREEKHG